MSREEYAEVIPGMSESRVMELAGKPFEVKETADRRTFVYVDRFEIAPEVTEEVRYVIHIKDGYVVDKEIERDEEMQMELHWE